MRTTDGRRSKILPSCGNPVQATQQQSPGLGDSYQRFANTPDSTAQFNPQDIANNKAMAILAYLGILVLVPIFAANNSPFARYHANQGLILLIVNIVLMIAAAISVPFSWPYREALLPVNLILADCINNNIGLRYYRYY